MNKIIFMLIICGFLSFLLLLPGVMDNAIYYYYRVLSGKTIKLDSKCYSIPDGWFIQPAEDVDSYNLLKKYQEQYEVASIFVANEDFQNRVQNSALLKQIDSDLYSIYEIPSSLMNNMTRYWLADPNNSMIIEGSSVPEVKLLFEGLRLSDC